MGRLIALFTILWCTPALACFSVKECSEQVSKSVSYDGVQAYGTVALAHAIEDLAKAIKEERPHLKEQG